MKTKNAGKKSALFQTKIHECNGNDLFLHLMEPIVLFKGEVVGVEVEAQNPTAPSTHWSVVICIILVYIYEYIISIL